MMRSATTGAVASFALVGWQQRDLDEVLEERASAMQLCGNPACSNSLPDVPERRCAARCWFQRVHLMCMR